MIVVSDTSPLTALLTVAQSDILPKLFSEVIVPEAVRAELLRNHPQLPKWLHAASVKDTVRVKRYSESVDSRNGLPGKWVAFPGVPDF